MTVPRIVWIAFSRFSGSAPENEMSLACMCALPPIVWAILRRRGVHVDRLHDPVVAAHPAGADPPQEPGHAAVLRLEARDDDRRELKLERPLARHAEAQAHVALEDRLALLDVLRVPQVARHVLVAEELDPKLVRIARLERGGDKHAVDAVARAEVLAVEPERELDVAPRLDLGRVEGRTGWREDGERRLAVHVAGMVRGAVASKGVSEVIAPASRNRRLSTTERSVAFVVAVCRESPYPALCRYLYSFS